MKNASLQTAKKGIGGSANSSRIRKIINWFKPITLCEKLYWLLVLIVGGVIWMR